MPTLPLIISFMGGWSSGAASAPSQEGGVYGYSRRRRKQRRGYAVTTRDLPPPSPPQELVVEPVRVEPPPVKVTVRHVRKEKKLLIAEPWSMIDLVGVVSGEFTVETSRREHSDN